MKKVILISFLVLAFVVAPAWASFFDIWPIDSFTSGPPYPATASILVDIAHEATPMVADAVLSANLEKASVGPGAGGDPIMAEVFASTPSGDYDIDSFFDITYQLPSGDFAVDSFFDITYQIDLPGGGSLPLAYTPIVDFAVDSFFDITYQIDFSDGSYHTINLRGEPLPDLKLANVGVGNVNMVDSFFDVFFDITLRDGAPTPDPTLPSMRITMTGEYVPEPVTLAVLILGGLALLRRRK